MLDLPHGKFRDKGQPIDNVSNYDSTKEKIKSFVFSVGVKVGDFYSKVKANYDTAKEKVKSF